jgi:hypothetical protein
VILVCWIDGLRGFGLQFPIERQIHREIQEDMEKGAGGTPQTKEQLGGTICGDHFQMKLEQN